MGYHTYFNGALELDKPLTPEHAAYLKAFSETRRMKRNEFKTVERPDPVREAVGLPVGEEGCYFVGGEEFRGQESSEDVVEYNRPPKGQPGLWCHWIPSGKDYLEWGRDEEDLEGMKYIVWDEGEKFYDYVNWIEYIIGHFLDPWGYKLNGEVQWTGDEDDDRGTIVVEDNVVHTRECYIIDEEDLLATSRKTVFNEIGKDLSTLVDYAAMNEAEDFLENIGEYEFISDDEKDIDKGIDEIYEAMVKEKKGDREILDLINSHIKNCSHIYVTILRINVWLSEVTS